MNVGGIMVKKTGRPTKYKAEFAEQAYKMCLLGATDVQLADFFGVCVSSVDKWKNAHPAFLQALKDGKEIADAKVVQALFDKAVGFSHPETKVFNDQGKIIEHTVTRHYAPDSTAAIFWLKNRQSQSWRDRVEQKVVLSDDFDEVLSLDDED